MSEESRFNNSLGIDLDELDLLGAIADYRLIEETNSPNPGRATDFWSEVRQDFTENRGWTMYDFREGIVDIEEELYLLENNGGEQNG